jgi:hypothetical protein
MIHNSAIEGIIDEKLLAMNTAYVAKVISVSGNKAKIQPLTMVKQYGHPAKQPSPVTAYILNNAQYKLKTKNAGSALPDTVPDGAIENLSITAEKLSKDDIVFCVCADRDMSETVKGNFATPPIGHHSMSDSVIIGVL